MEYEADLMNLFEQAVKTVQLKKDAEEQSLRNQKARSKFLGEANDIVEVLKSKGYDKSVLDEFRDRFFQEADARWPIEA